MSVPPGVYVRNLIKWWRGEVKSVCCWGFVGSSWEHLELRALARHATWQLLPLKMWFCHLPEGVSLRDFVCKALAEEAVQVSVLRSSSWNQTRCAVCLCIAEVVPPNVLFEEGTPWCRRRSTEIVRHRQHTWLWKNTQESMQVGSPSSWFASCSVFSRKGLLAKMLLPSRLRLHESEAQWCISVTGRRFEWSSRSVLGETVANGFRLCQPDWQWISANFKCGDLWLGAKVGSRDSACLTSSHISPDRTLQEWEEVHEQGGVGSISDRGEGTLAILPPFYRESDLAISGLIQPRRPLPQSGWWLPSRVTIAWGHWGRLPAKGEEIHGCKRCLKLCHAQQSQAQAESAQPQLCPLPLSQGGMVQDGSSSHDRVVGGLVFCSPTFFHFFYYRDLVPMFTAAACDTRPDNRQQAFSSLFKLHGRLCFPFFPSTSLHDTLHFFSSRAMHDPRPAVHHAMRDPRSLLPRENAKCSLKHWHQELFFCFFFYPHISCTTPSCSLCLSTFSVPHLPRAPIFLGFPFVFIRSSWCFVLSVTWPGARLDAGCAGRGLTLLCDYYCSAMCMM